MLLWEYYHGKLAQTSYVFSCSRAAVLCYVHLCASLFSTCKQKQVACGCKKPVFHLLFSTPDCSKVLCSCAVAAFLQLPHRGLKHKTQKLLVTHFSHFIAVLAVYFSCYLLLQIYLSFICMLLVNHWTCTQVHITACFYILLKTAHAMLNCCRDLVTC